MDPYFITKQVEEVAYWLQLPHDHSRVYNMFHMS